MKRELEPTHTGNFQVIMLEAVEILQTTSRLEDAGRPKDKGLYFRYIVPKQLYIDAKVAGSLCVGGPIKYKLKPGITLTDDWVFGNVVPNIRRRYPTDSRLCRVLGLALLYGARDDIIGKSIPTCVRDRITQAYIPLYPETSQPVEKFPW